MSVEDAPVWLRHHGGRLTTVALVLALLYIGRAVLIPLALAILLSLLVAPLVRALRRIRIGRASSVLIAVLVLTISFMAAAVVLGTQILRIAESLPRYQANVQHKIRLIDEVTVGRLRLLTKEASHLMEIHDPSDTPSGPTSKVKRSVAAQPPDPALLEPRDVPPQPLQLMGKLLKSAWGPIQATGIVLLVLIFVLLEHESLRDRIIRIAGATDIRSTTAALNDAGERLSRLFVSQLAVNLVFAVTITVALSVLRVPQAILCGTLAGVMRFVPYVGVGIAALFAIALAFAVDPGWSLALSTLGVFILLDIVAAQLLEPHLYGHTTGLSPLSVVVAAIFWSSLWGPVGLVLSTPLTLCLLVAGRHVKALNILEFLLGDVQPLTLPQNFYQRALSADPHEIIANARAFLKRDSLATYCDRVLLPALHLAQLDAEPGATNENQQVKIRRVIVDVLTAVGSDSLKLPRRRHRGSVLEYVSAGRWLRQEREGSSGRWQGPLGVPPGSVVICSGLGSSSDDLAAELLVRMLRTQSIDARHFSSGDINLGLPAGAEPDGVSIVYLVSAFPSSERARANSISKQVAELLPRAYIVRVFCPGVAALSEPGNGASNTEPTVNSLGQAIEFCMSWQEVRNTPNPTPDLAGLMSRERHNALQHSEGLGRVRKQTEEVLQ
ncbi:AI-2E family transporter [Mycobacterium sp.]|uniref:AI-2E family transporter n=1 Tax=Mycobacterium sp. TaxID=1785 RepID=UPI003F9C30AA